MDADTSRSERARRARHTQMRRSRKGSPRVQRRGVRELEGVGERPEVVAGEARVDDVPPRFPEERLLSWGYSLALDL